MKIKLLCNFFLCSSLLITCSSFAADDAQPEKPGLWQRTKERAHKTYTSAKTAAALGTGYYLGSRASDIVHESGHAIAGAATGRMPTSFHVRITPLPFIIFSSKYKGEGQVKFERDPYYQKKMIDIPTRSLWRQQLPTTIAGPLAGLYFNYWALKALTSISDNESFENQLTQNPLKTGTTLALASGALINAKNLLPMISVDGTSILGSLVAPLLRNNYIMSASVLGSAYVTASLLGVAGTAWWLKNHLSTQFNLNPARQRLLEFEPITPENNE